MSPKQATLDLLATLLERIGWAAQPASLREQWDGLMPALLMGYGVTMSAADRAVLRLLHMLLAREQQEQRLQGGAAREASPVSMAGAWISEGPAGTG